MVDKPRVTAIGFKAGKSNKGGNNTFIGHSANKQASTQSGSNATAIGYQATVAGSNAIQLGNEDVTSLTVGDGGTGVTIYANGVQTASDERLKKLIKPLVSYGLSYIKRLNPVTWSWRSDDSMDAGFIAQEVQELSNNSKDPYGLVKSFNNPYTDEETLTVDYGKLVVPLVKAVQELSDEIEKLKSEIKDLESKLEN
jgi:polyhydroxyalkanoate synthesis regulator phasin